MSRLINTPAKKWREEGFTLIELMLSMAFVSVLLVAVAMLTIQIGAIFNRGITMKEVNQAGITVSEDIRRSIASGDAQLIRAVSDTNDGLDLLCTGTFTYIANDPEVNEGIRYSNNNETVRFAKVKDAGGGMCDDVQKLFTDNLDESATELLGNSDRDLVVRNLTISPTNEEINGDADATYDKGQGRMLYLVSLSIGTGSGGELSDETIQKCLPPSDVNSGAEYCAINQFSFAARVGNTK